MEKVINIGEYIISDNPKDVYKIYGLSSCIGLVIYCPKHSLLSVAHILLPSSDINPTLSDISPAYFADTGVDKIIDLLVKSHRCKTDELVSSIYGGADARNEKDIFNIGKRNVVAVRQKLMEHQIKIKNDDTGGNISRTLMVSVLEGEIVVNKLANKTIGSSLVL